MMEAGYEAKSLYELAGTSRPYNQFQLQELTNRVLKDLRLDYSDKIKTLKNYAYFLLTSNIDRPEKYINILRELRDIYFDPDLTIEFQDFALLYWAKEDFIDQDYQHYWEGAVKTNIDKIIKAQFELYIKKIDNEK